MAKTLTALIVAAFFGLFVSLFLTMFATSQATQYDTTANLTGGLDPGMINESIASGGAMYNDFSTSSSDQSSQISLFKNAPSTIKQQAQLSVHVFGRLFALSTDQFAPAWALGLVFSIFLIVLIGILIRMATGQTP